MRIYNRLNVELTEAIMACYSSSTPPIVSCFSCVLFIILYCGNGVIADAIFTNLWAVKVRGSQQEAEELAHRHGFSYDKHVSFTLVTASLLSPCSMLPFVRATVLCITPSIPQPNTH